MAVRERITGKKLEIVKWAFDRFYEGGFHATGIDALMAESGISKRTLYKYFDSKEDLISAVLDHYSSGFMRDLLEPALESNQNPRRVIMALFDSREAMIDMHPTRGCMGVKASLEYAGLDEVISKQGADAPKNVELMFIELCKRAGATKPKELGRQINILFQGAVIISQMAGNSSPFSAAKSAVATLLRESLGKDG